MFPITYGDVQADNELRISDKIVKILENKQFQRHILNMAGAVIVISTSTSAKAIPPEAGEAAVNAVNDAIKAGGECTPLIEGIANQGVKRLPVDQLNPANLNPPASKIPPVGNMPANMPAIQLATNNIIHNIDLNSYRKIFL